MGGVPAFTAQLAILPFAGLQFHRVIVNPASGDVDSASVSIRSVTLGSSRCHFHLRLILSLDLAVVGPCHVQVHGGNTASVRCCEVLSLALLDVCGISSRPVIITCQQCPAVDPPAALLLCRHALL
jgi:hypothetical protein